MGTVRGYKRVVMCQEVRDEIRAVLGEDEPIKAFLEALYDGRLLPTAWLNRVHLLTTTLLSLIVPHRCMTIFCSCASQAAQVVASPLRHCRGFRWRNLLSAPLAGGSGA